MSDATAGTAAPPEADPESDDEWPDVSDHGGSRDGDDDARGLGDEDEADPGSADRPPSADVARPAGVDPEPPAPRGEPEAIAASVDAADGGSPRAPAPDPTDGVGFIRKTGSVGALFGGDDGDAGPFGVPEAVPAAGPGFVEAPSHARAIGADAPGSPTDAVSRGVVSPTRATSNPFGGPGGDDDDDDDFFSNLASPTAPAPATPPFGAAPPPNASFAAATTGPASIATSATTAPAHHTTPRRRPGSTRSPRNVNVNISSGSPSARPLTSRSILSSI